MAASSALQAAQLLSQALTLGAATIDELVEGATSAASSSGQGTDASTGSLSSSRTTPGRSRSHCSVMLPARPASSSSFASARARAAASQAQGEIR